MREDIIIGLIVATFWGLFGILVKAASRNIELSTLNILVGLGIFLTALVLSLYEGLLNVSIQDINKLSMLFALLAGVSWFVATYFFNKGLSSGLNVSIIILVAGLNVIFVSLAGILLFKENVQLWRIVSASLLYMIVIYLLS